MGRGRRRRRNRHPLELVMGGKWKPGLRGKRFHLMGTRWNIEKLGTRSDIEILEYWGQDGTLMTFEASVLLYNLMPDAGQGVVHDVWTGKRRHLGVEGHLQGEQLPRQAIREGLQ